jgi:hypothetical protein
MPLGTVGLVLPLLKKKVNKEVKIKRNFTESTNLVDASIVVALLHTQATLPLPSVSIIIREQTAKKSSIPALVVRPHHSSSFYHSLAANDHLVLAEPFVASVEEE